MAIDSFLRSFTLLLLLATAIEAFKHHDYDHHNLHSHSNHHYHNHHHRQQLRNYGKSVKILLPQILSQLGFLDFATAASSLSSSSPADWPAGPSTVFAPSDASIRSYCGVPNGGSSTPSCSLADLFREYVVPGVFSSERLGNLSHGATFKIETLTQGHCVTVTKRTENQTAKEPQLKIVISGVEITRPDLFNNGFIVVHGLRGIIGPLSPFSCDFNHQDHQESDKDPTDHQSLHFSTNPSQPASASIMRLMLRDAMQRLRATGYGVLALALRVKYPELVKLESMTIFAVNDVSIFTGGLHSYVGNIRFHIVPDAYLTMADLEKLPLGTIIPTLAEGQSLVVTAAGYGGLSPVPMRINYVRIRLPEIMRNFKIIVHSLYLPFPHIRSVSGIAGDNKNRLPAPTTAATTTAADEVDGKCFIDLRDGVGGRVCVTDHHNHIVVPPEKPTAEIEEDHHGL